MQDLVRADADGYTWFVGNVSTNALTPVLHAGKLPIEVEKDLQPVTMLADVQNILVTTKVNFPPTSLKEIIAYAKERPGQVRHSSAGVGSYPHLDFIALARAGAIQITHVPNRAGAGSGSVDLINGDLHLSIVNAASITPLIEEGKVRAIGVTSDSRVAKFPDLPTLAELGMPNVGTNNWNALFVKAGTRPEILARIHEIATKAMLSPDVKDVLEKQQFRVRPSESPAKFSEWLKGDVDRWRKFVADNKITMN